MGGRERNERVGVLWGGKWEMVRIDGVVVVVLGMEKVEVVLEECMKKVMVKVVVGLVRGVLKMLSMIVG